MKLQINNQGKEFVNELSNSRHNMTGIESESDHQRLLKVSWQETL